MSTRDPKSEDVRTMFAKEGLMYGNRDSKKVFPFDIRKRFEYLVFSEKLGETEDGQIYSKKTTQRYSFFSPEAWENLVNGNTVERKNYFERKKLKYTILHDPFVQAKLEGKNLLVGNAKLTNKSLEQRLSEVKTADQFAKEGGEEFMMVVSDFIEADEIEMIDNPSEEDLQLASPKKRPAQKRRGVANV